MLWAGDDEAAALQGRARRWRSTGGGCGSRKPPSVGEEAGEKGTGIYTVGAFGPGSSHHPGPKGLWSRVVAGTGTKGPHFGPGWSLHPGPKGVLAGRGENAPVAHL